MPVITEHESYESVDDDRRRRMDFVASQLCPDGMRRVTDMDEWYVSHMDPKRTVPTSDDVFEMEHVDGPFSAFSPVLYRCIYAVQGHEGVSTIVGTHRRTLTTGEHLMFDYNRDLHRIVIDPMASGTRIVMKLHFVTEGADRFAWCNATWNKFARQLFLWSRDPDTLWTYALARVIHVMTRAKRFIMHL
jgi:hypothetical protein